MNFQFSFLKRKRRHQFRTNRLGPPVGVGRKHNLILIIIFFFAFFLRFWKVPELFFFGIDEEYQTLLAQTIINNFHIIWIGLSAANTGYYIGSGLVYLHAVLLWLSKGDPLIFGYFASLTGIATLVVYYFVVKNLFSCKVAVISSILYGLSAFVVYYDRRFWNSTLVPLTAILFFFSLVKAKKNSRWYILTVFLIASSFHIHASLFILIPIAIFILIYQLIQNRQKISRSTFAISIAIYFVITSPLFVYDLVHNFDNIKTPLRMWQQIGKGSSSFSLIDHWNIFSTTLVRFWFDNPLPKIIFYMVIFISAIIISQLFFEKETRRHTVLKTIVAFYLLMFAFYPGKILDYYLLGFTPFFTISAGLFFQNVNNRLVILLVALFSAVNVWLINNWSDTAGLSAKKQLIRKTATVIGNRHFYLTTNRDYIYFGGWRYLFEIYGKRPAQSQADRMFGWIYPQEIDPQTPAVTVIVADQKQNIANPLAVIHEGAYYAYITQE